jgi:glycosyltransferase involved in cell wall biosynthesis
LAQRHSCKELIIVYEDNDPDTAEMADRLTAEYPGLLFATKVSAMPKRSLGELRNIAIAAAHGDYVCQWDDDDWYHRDRISSQLEAAVGNSRKASLLTHWIIYDEVCKQAYFSLLRLWEGSLLCRRDAFTEEVRYPALSRGEDSVLITTLIEKGYFYPLIAPNLYIYTVHYGNTWPRSHFDWLFSRSQKLSAETSVTIGKILAGAYSIDEASELLSSPDLTGEFRYFQEQINFAKLAGVAAAAAKASSSSATRSLAASGA